MASIDELDIQIKANADKASDAITRLTKNLSILSAGLASLNTVGLTNLADGVQKLGIAMNSMKGISSKSFDRLVTNINKLGSVNTANILNASSALDRLVTSVSSFSGVTSMASDMATLAQSLGSLGSAKISRAITYIPQLTTQLQAMMTTLARAPTVSARTVSLINALGSLSGRSLSVGRSSSVLTSGLHKTSNAMNKAEKSSFSLAAAFGKFYATYFLVIRGIKKLWSATESSMNYVETYNYFNTTLGKIEDDFKKRYDEFGGEDAETYAKSFGDRLKTLNQKMTGYAIGENGELNLTNSVGLGMNPEQMMNFQAQIMGITNAVGLMGETSVNTSKALSMLAGDLSSLTNKDLSKVMNDLQSGLIGQSRALYKYGIDITNNTLQQKAYELGIQKSVSAMTQAEKMQLRLLTILQDSRVSWADLAGTLNSSANMYRQLTAAASNLGRTIGSILLPAVKAVLPTIIGFTIAMNNLLDTLGYKIWGNDWKKNLMDGISGFAAAEDVAEGLEDELEGVADSAKKAKNGIRGFDELNVINTKNDSGKGMEDTIDLMTEIQDAVSEYEKIWNKAYEDAENKAQIFADNLTALLTSEDYELIGQIISNKIANTLNGLDWNQIRQNASNFGTNFALLLNGLIDSNNFAVVGSTIAQSINSVFAGINSFADTFDFAELGESLSNGLNSFVNDIDVVDIAKGISHVLSGLGTATSIFLKNTDFYMIGQKIATFLINIDWQSILLGVVDAFWEGLKGAFEVWTGMFDVEPIFTTIITAIAGTITVAKWMPVITSVMGALVEGFTSFIEIFEGLNLIGIGIAAVIGAGLISAFINNKDIQSGVLESLAGIFDNFKTIISGIVDTVIPDLIAGFERLMEVIEPLINVLNDIFASVWRDIIIPILQTLSEQILPSVISVFGELWNNILVPLASFVADVLSPVFSIISLLLEVLWHDIVVPLGQVLIDVLGVAFTSVADILNRIVIPLFNFLIKVVQTVWDEALEPLANWIIKTFTPTILIAGGIIEKVINTIKDIFIGLVDFIVGVFTGDWDKAWQGVAKIFEGVFGGIVDIAKSVINLVISIINGMLGAVESALNYIINAINKLKIDVPDWVPGIGGETFGFNLGTVTFEKIQYLASGGFPDKSSVFVAGENGIPEMLGQVNGKTAVAGGEEITGIADAVYSTSDTQTALLRQQNELLLAILNKETGISKDDLFRSVRSSANDYFSRTGRQPFPT